MSQKTGFDRRSFLMALGGGLAAAGARGQEDAATKGTEWTMRLSASSVAFTKLSIEEACERIAALGFEAIDIWCPFRGCVHLKDVGDRLGADGLRALLTKTKLKLNAFSVYTTGYRPYAKLLGDVGGGVAVRGSQGGLPKAGELTKRMKAFFEKLKPDAELAAKHNSYIAIENHGNALLHTLDSFKAFVDLNPSDRIGIALAPYHLQGAKVSIPEAIKVAGKQLRYFYAWQRAKGVGQLPGHGPADVKPWLQALAEINYEGYVNPFMHHEPEPDAMSEALGKSRAYLLECGEAVGAQTGI